MAKKLWQVEAGTDHPDYEGIPPAVHVYESAKDAHQITRTIQDMPRSALRKYAAKTLLSAND